MLGSVSIAKIARGRHVVNDDGVGVAERLGGDFGARELARLVRHGVRDSLQIHVRERHQNHLAVRPVLGLRQEIGGDVGGGGVFIRDDEHLTRARGHVDGNHRV